MLTWVATVASSHLQIWLEVLQVDAVGSQCLAACLGLTELHCFQALCNAVWAEVLREKRAQ